ncbi:prephenate dehydrogenase [Lentisphaerota bacterium ZTH]|nr:prephenate dehydrogenase [Lentisphaerota bacterium]WET05501.1 prephenate dehydrogenase [Lentisphaerota bacterium ZTH]
MNTSEAPEIRNIAIIGLGLLGASLGMSLRGQKLNRLGWTRRPEVCTWAQKNNVIDETGELEYILKKADLTVLCIPIPQIMNFIKTYRNCWRPGSIVTDIGSVKAVIVNCGEKELQPLGVNFVGSHPMAGTEKTGPYAAFEALYNNAEVFVIRTDNTSAAAFQKVSDFWESIQTKVVEIGVKEHDVLVAHTSHISHILALSLTEAVLDCPEAERKLRFSGCATGFRDTSRITSSSPQMWREIIENNQPAVLEVVKEFEKRWLHLCELIESKQYDKLQSEFAKGKNLRDRWINYKNTEHDCNW